MYKLFLKALNTLPVKQNTTLTWVTFMLCKFVISVRQILWEQAGGGFSFLFEGFLAASAQVWVPRGPSKETNRWGSR